MFENADKRRVFTLFDITIARSYALILLDRALMTSPTDVALQSVRVSFDSRVNKLPLHSEGRGHGFESCRARHFYTTPEQNWELAAHW
jgi:hypothetical protein